MANKATTDAIQQDWKEREMIEVVHLNILKLFQAWFRSSCSRSPSS
ncbi:expressed unknown protein [Ectocarpus siliculosus]|uniref:Uncharacterized protein n=1 Tax=Ectocarpus siliculosus TaxID=2880 RepID=D7FM22_ECTSI|nr:expressed unknown protein [Ectocarpus siliculosus]|eukprot:CBJ29847.1 expressed unknown protein [Ectocarpus siliculosus]